MLLLGVTWLEVAVLLVAGGGLLIALPAVVAIWPWPLTPFNLRFLGALYSAALLAAFIQARVGRWAPARTVTLMIFVFTLVVTVCSFMHLDRFDFGKAQVWIWFLLYVGVCLNAGLHLWLYRRLPLAGQPPRSRTVLLVCAGILGVYGLALLLVPDLAARLWPWKIDRFHAQLYSVSFLTPAAGALSLRRCAARIDLFTLGVTLLAWGLLPMLALVVGNSGVGLAFAARAAGGHGHVDAANSHHHRNHDCARSIRVGVDRQPFQRPSRCREQPAGRVTDRCAQQDRDRQMEVRVLLAPTEN